MKSSAPDYRPGRFLFFSIFILHENAFPCTIILYRMWKNITLHKFALTFLLDNDILVSVIAYRYRNTITVLIRRLIQ